MSFQLQAPSNVPSTPAAEEQSLESMSEIERRDFKRLDALVAEGMGLAVEASLALYEIRERRLYRDKHKTFEEYCQSVHDMSRQYMNRLINAGRVRREMETIVSNEELELPHQESHLRVLGQIADPGTRVQIYQQVVQESATLGRPINAKHLSAAVKQHLAASPVTISKPGATQRHKVGLELLDRLEQIIQHGGNTAEVIGELRKLLQGNARTAETNVEDS